MVLENNQCVIDNFTHFLDNSFSDALASESFISYNWTNDCSTNTTETMNLTPCISLFFLICIFFNQTWTFEYKTPGSPGIHTVITCAPSLEFKPSS